VGWVCEGELGEPGVHQHRDNELLFAGEEECVGG